MLEQVNRVERQAVVLLRALHSIYIALGAFAAATLIMLLGEGPAPWWGGFWSRALAGFGIILNLVGVGGLVFGSLKLSQATGLSLDNLRAEAALIRARQTLSANRGKLISQRKERTETSKIDS
jgi:hypothetical protein